MKPLDRIYCAGDWMLEGMSSTGYVVKVAKADLGQAKVRSWLESYFWYNDKKIVCVDYDDNCRGNSTMMMEAVQISDDDKQRS